MDLDVKLGSYALDDQETILRYLDPYTANWIEQTFRFEGVGVLDENSNYRSVLGGLLSETTGTRYHKLTRAYVDYAISEGFKGVLNYFE